MLIKKKAIISINIRKTIIINQMNKISQIREDRVDIEVKEEKKEVDNIIRTIREEMYKRNKIIKIAINKSQRKLFNNK
jgi:hypothetical protein